MTSKILAKQKNKPGVALVEVVVAMGISVMVLTSLVSLSLYTLRSSLQSKMLLEGTKMANRELELVRAVRDSIGWTSFTNAVTSCTQANPCHVEEDLTVQAGKYDEVIGTLNNEVLSRSFYVNFTAADIARVTVSVEWTVGSQSKVTHLYTDLTDWRTD